MADILGLYRRTPLLPAFALATLGAAIIALGIAAAGLFAITKTLEYLRASGPGAGILVVTAVPNIIIPSFIIALTLLTKLHGRVSWKTPTLAFLAGGIATWIWIGPFDLMFAPFVLGTGALTCGVSCLILQRKGASQAQRVL